jgi:hypothetical protein
MGIVIGSGIRIGGGISVVREGSVTPNSIVDATITQNGYDWYGAYDYTTGYANFGISDFGTVTSDYFYAIMLQTDGVNTVQTNIALNDGSYTGFTVVNGVIDGDLQSYPRVFTIGGTNYTFNLGAQGFYFAYPDPLNLSSSVGSTITTVYNPAIQPSLTPNSIIVAQYQGGGGTSYGANKTGATGYGTIVSDYLTEVSYANLSTNIYLAPGTYTGFTVDSNGAIDGDNSTARTFTINGVDAVFTVAGSAPYYSYTNMGNPFSLSANVGNTLTAIYDPAAQPVPGPGEFVSGTMTVGTDGIQYGWQSPMIGSSTIGFPTDPTYQILYGAVSGSPTLATTIIFISGTYGTTVVDGAAATIDGENSITVTIDGVTEIGTLATNTSGPPGCTLQFAGDIFSLQSKNTQTLAVTMVAGAATPGVVATGSITVGNDGPSYGYGDGSGFPPFGSSTIAPAMVSRLYWVNNSPSGSTNIRLTAGTYGTVVVDDILGTVDGETQLTMVVDGISQTGTLYGTGGGVEISPPITGDPYGLQAKNGQTLTVSVIAGAGGGGGTTYTSMGNWTSSGFGPDGPGWRVNLNLYGPGTSAGLVSALNALTVGSTFSITDSTSATASVTVSSISGQPFSESSFVTIYVNTPSPTPPSNWPAIASITI